jgi:hypothetical protein
MFLGCALSAWQGRGVPREVWQRPPGSGVLSGWRPILVLQICYTSSSVVATMGTPRSRKAV